MFPSRSRLFLPPLGIIAFVLLAMLAATGHAADVSVRARLSRSISVIGDPVELQIKISGGRRIGDPPEVPVEGLAVQYRDPARQRRDPN